MMPTRQGSIRLFRLFGINLFLHWSWFLVGVIEIQDRRHAYGGLLWNVLEYLALFVLVTLHEFGHALACRQVGGQANQIVLWPLGGVAYVAPPQRAGAMLWSIAAGPLVNVVLAPPLWMLYFHGTAAGWAQSMPDFFPFLQTVCYINTGLLAFNLLPVYPLDGGQILRSLLWFVFGRARSLLIATCLGFVGVLGLIALAIWIRSLWFGLVTAFLLVNCWRGWMQARALDRLDRAPRREGYACPVCQVAPRRGLLWLCGKCRQSFDTFETHALCPYCQARFTETPCFECGNLRPFSEWSVPDSIPPRI
jgi:hypothetical protein